MNKIRKTIAVLLAVLFLVTVTVGAASAMKVLVINADVQGKLPNEDISNSEVKNIGKTPSVVQGSGDTSRETIIATYKPGNGVHDIQSSDDSSRKTITATSYRRTAEVIQLPKSYR